MYLLFVGIAATTFTDNSYPQPLPHLVLLTDHQELFVFSKITDLCHTKRLQCKIVQVGRLIKEIADKQRAVCPKIDYTLLAENMNVFKSSDEMELGHSCTN